MGTPRLQPLTAIMLVGIVSTAGVAAQPRTADSDQGVEVPVPPAEGPGAGSPAAASAAERLPVDQDAPTPETDEPADRAADANDGTSARAVQGGADQDGADQPDDESQQGEVQHDHDDQHELDDGSPVPDAADVAKPQEEATPSRPLRDEGPAPVRRPDLDAKAPVVVSVGVEGGGVLRWASGGGVDYGPGPQIAVFARPRITSWLWVRALYRHEWQPVSIAPGAYDFRGSEYPADLAQPSLEGDALAFFAEPTWQFSERLQLYGQAGISWTGLEAPAPRFEGFELVATRRASEIAAVIGLGAAVDLIVDRLAVHARLEHGFVFDRFGTAYEPLQGIVDGQVTYFSPLSTSSGTSVFSLALGLAL